MKQSVLLLMGTLFCLNMYGQAPNSAKKQEFAIILHLSPKYQDETAWTAADNAAVSKHFEALQLLKQKGKVVFAGRTLNKESLGIVVLQHVTEAEAWDVIKGDVAVQRGIMQAELQPFHTALKE